MPTQGGTRAVYSPLKEGMESMSDSDWATGHSISGFVIFMALGAIMWASKKQPVTSLSSTEAEYYAASAAGAEVLALRHFMRHVAPDSVVEPTPLHVDNSACVDLAKDFNSCKRTKHIDRRVNFLTDYHKMGELTVSFISTKEKLFLSFRPRRMSQTSSPSLWERNYLVSIARNWSMRRQLLIGLNSYTTCVPILYHM